MSGDEVRGSEPRAASTRDFISPAALFVNVTASICHGGTPACSIRCPTRQVMTRVFPEPAPAKTSNGPSMVPTASSCWGLRFIERGLGVRGRGLAQFLLTELVLSVGCWLQ